MLTTRWLDVAPDRLGRWIGGFGDRHGGLIAAETADAGILLRAADGSVAEAHVPFPPVLAWSTSGPAIDPDCVDAALRTVAEHIACRRRVGVILLRMGGYAVGVFDGAELVRSKCGTRLVHARQRNGGSSQKRFARRRENEVRAAVDAAAGETARVVLPERRRLDALVCGGDRNAVRTMLTDLRLSELTPLVVERFLDVPDPRRDVLDRAPALFGAIQVRLTQP